MSVLDSFDGVEIGTRLKVRDDLVEEQSYDHVVCTQEMASHRGETVFVTGIISEHSTQKYIGNVHVGTSPDITLKRGNWRWVWSPGMFECIVDGQVEVVSLLDILKEECV